MAPDLPGCVAAGDSVEETRELLADAFRLHLEMMDRSGEPMPIPARRIELAVDELERDELCTWVDIKPPRPRVHKRRTVGGRK